MSASSFTTDRCWLSFRGSDMQRVLHDHLTRELETARTELETADSPSVPTLQATAKVVRRLLEFIHQHDTPQVEKTYGRN